MKINIKKIIYYLVYIYIAFKFIIYINEDFLKILDYVFLTLITVFILIYIHLYKVRASKDMLIMFLLMFCTIIIQMLFSNFGCIEKIRATIFLIYTYFLFKYEIVNNENYSKKNIIYYIVCIYLSLYLLKWIKNGLFLKSDYNFYLLCVPDKNISALIIFMFMCFCFNDKKILGILISIIYTIFLNSRMTQLGVIIYIFFNIIIFKKTKMINNFILKLTTTKIFTIIILSQMFLIGFSYYFTYNIDSSKITNYQESFIDKSNAMRVRSNIYAFRLLKEDYRLIFYGYDNKMKTILGIEDIYNSPIFMGFRLVQPHSLFLNMILTYGLIYSLIYVGIISYFIKRFLNVKNLSFVIIYIIMNMILPLLFIGPYLIYFMFVLCSFSKKEVKYGN